MKKYEVFVTYPNGDVDEMITRLAGEPISANNIEEVEEILFNGWREEMENLRLALCTGDITTYKIAPTRKKE